MRCLKALTVMTISLQLLVFPCLNSSLLAEPVPIIPERTTGTQGYSPMLGPNYPVIPESYFTDDNGNILMVVNVLGEVGSPGQIVVSENADFPSLLSRAGGIKPTANLKKVLVARYRPDNDGKQAYKIDLKPYYEEGDRSAFIALKPNDTIIIPEKKGLTLDLIYRITGIVVSSYTIYSIFK
jgi:hypothetical protein